jgi:phosphoribosylformylglycinamidine synthase subunit PurL
MKMLLDKILNAREQQALLNGLGREPTSAELAMVSAMWSEHCGYKHSRHFLKQLPRDGEQVLAGPGENAGIIRISDSLAVAFKIESHNHPSAVVPYQGAATGVGGILRDIFTMGSEPIALMNSLHFDVRDHRGKWIAEHVVDGIADYGNCTGIPTVAGEYASYPWFIDNPLVNVVCAGMLKPEQVLKASTAQANDLVLYFGNKTGRDGIAGAIFASLNLTDETREQKSAVQVGDPFMGKLIMQATLELIRRGIPSAMQDMGAAGITCSTSEIAHNSGLGIIVELDAVPVRAPGITAEEILLSESQERMLATVPADKKELAEEILRQYPLDFAWIGRITDTPEMEVRFQNEIVAKAPLDLLVDGCPVEDYSHLTEDVLRAGKERVNDLSGIAGVNAAAVPTDTQPDLAALLERYRATSHYASPHHIFEQFDYEINQRTISGPGDDHTLLHEPDSGRTIAFTVHSRSPWTLLHAYRGTRALLAAAFRRSIAAGAYPLGISNCLNFPSPDREETVVDFGGTTLAMQEFCTAMEAPVTGGNVSFYNESEVGAIAPTPVFVLVGESVWTPTRYRYAGETGTLYLSGQPALAAGDLYSTWRLHVDGSLHGAELPSIDFGQERELGEAVLDLIRTTGERVWVRDIGKGGVFKRLVERFARADRDIRLTVPAAISQLDLLFGEGACTYLLFVPDTAEPDLTRLQTLGLRDIGRVEAGSGCLHVDDTSINLVSAQQHAAASLEPFWTDQFIS